MSRTLSKIAFALAFLIILGTGSYILFSLRTLIESNRKVSHTLITLNKLDHILTHVTELETGPHGFVITGHAHDLELYFAALSSEGITRHLLELHQLSGGDSLLQSSLVLLEPLVAKKIMFTQKIVDLRKKRGFDAAKQLISTDIGKETMDEIRGLIAVMKQKETGMLRQGSEEASASLQNMIFSLITGGVLSLLLVISINREVGARRRSAKELKQLNGELDQRVQERTIQLEEELEKRMQEELKVQNLTRLYATLSQINEAIVRVTDRNELFTTACRVAVEHGKFGLAWIGLLDGKTGMVTPEFINASRQQLHPLKPLNLREIPFSKGIMGSAVETGAVRFCKNIQTDPTMQHWREMAISGGFHSAAAVPLRQNGVIIGLLNLYASEVDFFTEGQLQLLEEIARDLSFALDTMVLEEKQEQAEQALIKSEQKFREMFNGHSANMLIIDPDTGYILEANPAAMAFYGWSTDELKKMRIQEINTLTPLEIKAAMEKSRKGEKNYFLFRHRRANGSVRDVDVYSSTVEIAGKCLLFTVFHDVTDRLRLEKTNEFRLSILNMASNKSLNDLLQLTIDTIEKQTESSIGFFHFVGDDQSTLTLQIWSTNTVRNMCTAEGRGQHYELNEAGIWADALRERKAVIHNDFASITDRKGMPEGHAEVRREALVPIFRNQRVVAIIGVGNKLVNYNDDDIKLAGMLADAAWDVIAKKVADDEQKTLQLQKYIIENLAMHDSLTGLPNRRLLSERITFTIGQCHRNKTMAALFVFDLDRFKMVNDTLGHQAGDQLLQEVATRVLGILRRSGDSLARLGGDEYVVLLSQIAALSNAVAIAEKIKYAILQPFEIEGHTINISCSIGIAIYPEHGEDERTLMKHADAAMYQAKREGRNGIKVFGPETV